MHRDYTVLLSLDLELDCNFLCKPVLNLFLQVKLARQLLLKVFEVLLVGLVSPLQPQNFVLNRRRQTVGLF